MLDTEPYRYRASTSDIAGQDIHVHKNEPVRVIREVRDWLASISKTRGLPGGAEIAARHRQFMSDLPQICANLKRQPDEQSFADFSETVEIWLKSAR